MTNETSGGYETCGLDEQGLYYAPIDRTRRGYPSDIWERAREGYEGGLTVAAVCEQVGVSRSALFERAKGEGWRRPAPAVGEPVASEDEQVLLELGPIDPHEAADAAWLQVSLAMRLGRLQQAAGWTRLYRQFRQIAKEDEARAARAQTRDDAAANEGLIARLKGIEVEAKLGTVREKMAAAIEKRHTEAQLEAVKAGEAWEEPPEGPLLNMMDVLQDKVARDNQRLAELTGGPWVEAEGPEPDSPDSPDRFSESGENSQDAHTQTPLPLDGGEVGRGGERAGLAEAGAGGIEPIEDQPSSAVGSPPSPALPPSRGKGGLPDSPDQVLESPA